MTGNVVQFRRGQDDIPQSTYGALAESNVTALEALLSEVRRTYAHVLWLEDYVSKLPESSVFSGQTFHPVQVEEWERTGKYPQPDSIAWMLAVEQAKKLGVVQAKKPQVDLGVQQLLKERQHLVYVSTQAIRVGIALDEIELAKQHGELLVQAMTRFATSVGLDPTDKNVVRAMLEALDNTTELST